MKLPLNLTMPPEVIAEVKDFASRRELSTSWVLAQAWRIAKDKLTEELPERATVRA